MFGCLGLVFWLFGFGSVAGIGFDFGSKCVVLATAQGIHQRAPPHAKQDSDAAKCTAGWPSTAQARPVQSWRERDRRERGVGAAYKRRQAEIR